MRRKFLKTGLTGGTILAFLPLKRFISSSNPPPDLSPKSDLDLPKEYSESLVELNREYGGEFGEVEA